MATALDIIALAFAGSRENEPGRSAELSGEMLALLNELIPQYIGDGARVNTVWFAERITVDFADGGWARPEDAEMVLRLEAADDTVDDDAAPITAGDEIADLPYDQRQTELGRPAVYSLGRVWRPAGRAQLDPVAGSLDVIAVRHPAALATVDDDLPASWPAKQGNPVLKYELQKFLVMKEGGREAELPGVESQLARAKERYLNFLAHERITEVRTTGHGGAFGVPRATPA